MRITKYGHCCLLIEENGKRILTDPGIFSTQQNDVMNVDAIVITHDHADHFHIESVKKILEKNPSVMIICNRDTAAHLEKEKIAYTKVEDGEETMIGEVRIKGVGTEHAVMYAGVTMTMNTGYFIGDRLFYPGDSFVQPSSPVDVLALPVAGPWMKLSEALDYAFAVKPAICVPVHDGMLKNPSMMTMFFEGFLNKKNIRYVELKIDSPTEL